MQAQIHLMKHTLACTRAYTHVRTHTHFLTATEQLVLQPIKQISGTVRLPGSKSISNRVLLLAALAEGTTVVKNLLVGVRERERETQITLHTHTHMRFACEDPAGGCERE